MLMLKATSWLARASVTAFLFFLNNSAEAQLLIYHVDLTHASERYADVTMKIVGLRPDTLLFQMPVWAPGVYSEIHYGRFIHDVTAYDSAGRELPVEHIKTDRWKIVNATSIRLIRYRVKNSADDGSPMAGLAHIDADGVFANAEALFGYINSDKSMPGTIIFELPKDWQIATTLESATTDDVTDGNRWHQLVYKLSDYEQLADAPIIAAPALRTTMFNEGGIDYSVVVAGNDAFDLNGFASRARKVVQAETSFYGKVPYDDYTFAVYASPDGIEPFGLAHEASSVYTVGANTDAESLSQLIASTFFKTWNGEQFHISSLGPIDFTAPLAARSLWFTEGLSDYYATLLLVRYAGMSPSTFFHAVDEWEALAERADRISLEELSARLSGAGRKYDAEIARTLRARGALAALAMDIEIRSKTKGRSSLDNVLLRMNAEAPSGKTYDDKKLIQAIETYAKVPLDSLYVHCIAGGQALPIEVYLDKIGAARELPESMKQNGEIGFDLALNAAGSAIIAETPRDTAMFSTQVVKGDTVTAINGEKVTKQAVAEAKSAFAHGEPVNLKIVKNAHPLSVTIKKKKSDQSALTLRNGLIGKRKVAKRVKHL